MTTLEEHFARYLKACQEADYKSMLPFMHPEVVRHGRKGPIPQGHGRVLGSDASE
jgi:hypothetical protein